MRQTSLHNNTTPVRNTKSALHLYITEPRRADKIIPSVLLPLNARVDEAEECEMIDVNDFMADTSNNQRHITY